MTELNGHVAQHDGYSKGLEFTLSICICYTLSVLGLRLYIRWKTFAMDDVMVLLSTVSPSIELCNPWTMTDCFLWVGSSLRLFWLQLCFQQRRARPNRATRRLQSRQNAKTERAVSCQQLVVDHSAMLIKACYRFTAAAHNSHNFSPATAVFGGSIDLCAMDRH
jgi:hypothetical protein